MKLHKNAILTPKQRQKIKELYDSGIYSHESLAQQFGVNRKTIIKWVSRTDFGDKVGLRTHQARLLIHSSSIVLSPRPRNEPPR